MRISHITIKNILGIRDLEFTPTGFTEITGHNGSNKSSTLEAIKSVFKGGHDATLLHEGAEKGEIVLVLDDGTEIKKVVREHTSDTSISKDGRRLPKPAELIKSLVDKLSNNPIEFLTAKKDDRVSIFLQSVPLVADIEKLQQISGVKVPNVEGMHAYHVIEHVYTQVYDDRTGTQRAVKEKEATIIQLRQAMPEQSDGVIGGEEELEGQLIVLDAQKDKDLGEVHTKLSSFTTQINAEMARVINKYDAQIEDLQRQIEALRQNKAQETKALQERVTVVETKANAKRQEIKDTHRDNRAPVETQLSLLRTNRNLAARRAQTLDTIKILDLELVSLKNDVTRQEKALDGIKQYKSDLLASLPIPGVEVRNGEIYRDNIVFDRLNAAQRVGIAVEIAKLRAGELGVICVDGIELLDSATFNEFRTQSQAVPHLQFFVSRVTDGAFNINTGPIF